MIDFAALLAEKRARMTPEERERFDAAVAAREAIEATEHPIPAVFEVLVWKRPSGLAALKAGQQALPERAVDHTYERDVRIRIEPRDNGAREVIQFVGAVTGHEAFELTPDLCAELASDAGGPGRSAQGRRTATIRAPSGMPMSSNICAIAGQSWSAGSR